jgi:phosphatidylserine/phosphatidylglycerophosphate/cardiolipin synthase-like enzyme
MKRPLVQLAWILAGLISILSLQSCQSGFFRKPSSDSALDEKKIEQSYSDSITIDSLRAEEKKLVAELNRAEQNSPNDTTLDDLKARLIDLKSRIHSLEQKENKTDEVPSFDRPAKMWGLYKRDFRKQKEMLVLSELKSYALKSGQMSRKFKMDLNGTIDYQLGIVNKLWGPTPPKTDFEEEGESDVRRYLEASIKCDADFRIKKVLFTRAVKKNQVSHFKIYEQANNSAKVILHFDQNVSACELTFVNPEEPQEKYGLVLESNVKDTTHLAEVKDRFETCVLPDASGLTGPEKLFLTPDYKSMTCAEEITDIKTLEGPIDGLKEKAEALLGQALPEGFIEKMDPYAPLDFSKAPKLNTVLISYLVFRHDYYGTLMARLAKWHADHGAQVRILISDVIANKKDRILLHSLVENSNNIKVQEFRYDSDGGPLWDHFSELHRTMHVKLLITLSDNAADNVVFIGGRNIHDGFVFMKNPDVKRFPELVQYGSYKGADEGYAPWRDFEMRIRSKKFAEQVASHYMTLWQRDSQSFYVRSINQNLVSKTPVDPQYFKKAKNAALIRHFMSIPYKDDDALEKLYIQVFESAQKSIRLSTPYFRPTKKLGEAMQRAVERGVEVSLITRIDLSGDTAAIILSEVNKAGINRFLNKIKIYEYTEPGVILHSKIILVDGKVSFIGSVNLNKRSFVHDMESGVMIYNPAFNAKMNKVMDGYLKQARVVTEKQKIALWKRVVIGLFDEEF